jgi:arylsulfatase
MNYTFDAANASKPSTHKIQYFEMMGVHAIYSEGWVAATTPVRPPWVLVCAMPSSHWVQMGAV